MPILEAQLLGTPVVTTQFGAMADFTHYGIAVPPLQPHFLVRGWCAMPHLDGVVAALQQVHAGALPLANRTRAREWVRTSMSSEVVVASFDALLRQASPSPPDASPSPPDGRGQLASSGDGRGESDGHDSCNEGGAAHGAHGDSSSSDAGRSSSGVGFNGAVPAADTLEPPPPPSDGLKRLRRRGGDGATAYDIIYYEEGSEGFWDVVKTADASGQAVRRRTAASRRPYTLVLSRSYELHEGVLERAVQMEAARRPGGLCVGRSRPNFGARSSCLLSVTCCQSGRQSDLLWL